MSAISHDNPQLSPLRTMNHFPALQSRLENIKVGSRVYRRTELNSSELYVREREGR